MDQPSPLPLGEEMPKDIGYTKLSRRLELPITLDFYSTRSSGTCVHSGRQEANTCRSQRSGERPAHCVMDAVQLS